MDIAILDRQRLAQAEPLPDLSAAQPGDLILTSPQPAHPTARLIMTGQTAKLRYTWVNAGWTHAAIYVGEGFRIVEATPESGVAEADLRNYLPKHLIRFRRVANLTPAQRLRIVERALSQVGKADYNRLKLLACAYHSKRWDVWKLPVVRKGHICSSLFTTIVDEVRGKRQGLFALMDQPPVPAMLSLSDELTDVRIDWL